MNIKTIIEKQSHGYLVMLHNGIVHKAKNQIEAKAIVDAEDKRLASIDGGVINAYEWRGVKRLVKGVK